MHVLLLKEAVKTLYEKGKIVTSSVFAAKYLAGNSQKILNITDYFI